MIGILQEDREKVYEFAQTLLIYGVFSVLNGGFNTMGPIIKFYCELQESKYIAICERNARNTAMLQVCIGVLCLPLVWVVTRYHRALILSTSKRNEILSSMESRKKDDASKCRAEDPSDGLQKDGGVPADRNDDVCRDPVVQPSAFFFQSAARDDLADTSRPAGLCYCLKQIFSPGNDAKSPHKDSAEPVNSGKVLPLSTSPPPTEHRSLRSSLFVKSSGSAGYDGVKSHSPPDLDLRRVRLPVNSPDGVSSYPRRYASSRATTAARSPDTPKAASFEKEMSDFDATPINV